MRKTKAQIEQERQAKEQRIDERLRLQQEKEQVEAAERIRKKREAEQREWLRKQRSRPRMELPSQYSGESIFVHQKIYEGYMKNKKISILSCRVEGGTGGKLITEYTTQAGGRGRLELLDLGPVPAK